MRRSPLTVATFVSACAAIAAGAAFADPPTALMYYSINGGPKTWKTLQGEALPDGKQRYYSVDGDRSWNAVCDVNADYAAFPQVGLGGTVGIQNTTTQPMTFQWGIDVGICPSITEGSLVGGVAIITFVADEGGSVACFGNVPLVKAMANDFETVGAFFACPTYFYTSGDGTVTYSTSFGTPMPSEIGPESIYSIGQHEQFILTGGDSVKITFQFIYRDATPTPQALCAGDVNTDGSVDSADLTDLLASWGTFEACSANVPSDIDENGFVDASDLAILIANWGPCAN